MMNVSELREALEGIPDDARIYIMHEVVGYDAELVTVEYNKKYNVVWLHETDE